MNYIHIFLLKTLQCLKYIKSILCVFEHSRAISCEIELCGVNRRTALRFSIYFIIYNYFFIVITQ